MTSPDVDEIQRAEQVVDNLLPRGVMLNVLAVEAGKAFAVRSPARIVRCDVIQAEPGIRDDADEHITVDLERDVAFDPDTYDVVICVNVLEHLHEPLRLFPIVRQTLKENGLFVAVLPNVASLKAFVTRLLPWSVQKRVLTMISAAPVHEHVRSVHSFSLRPASLLAAAQKGGWRVEYFRLYEGPMQKSLRRRLRLVGVRWSVTAALLRVLTLGLLTPRETGIIAVFSKSA